MPEPERGKTTLGSGPVHDLPARKQRFSRQLFQLRPHCFIRPPRAKFRQAVTGQHLVYNRAVVLSIDVHTSSPVRYFFSSFFSPAGLASVGAGKSSALVATFQMRSESLWLPVARIEPSGEKA